MKGTVMLLAIIALSFPTMTLQQEDCDDVYVAVEVSENTVSATATATATGDLSLLQNELNAVFQGVTSTTKLGFFSSSLGYQENSTTTTVTEYFDNFSGTKGGYLFMGLYNMLTTLQQSSKRVNLAVIYSSSLIEADLTPIVQNITSLEQKNYFVTLYAIGQAVSSKDKFYDQLNERIPGKLFTLSLESSVSGLSAKIRSNVRRCQNDAPPTTLAPQTPAGRCESCVLTQQSGNVYHERRCDMYIHCKKITQSDGSFTIEMTERFCPPDTLFDPSSQGCNHARDVLKQDSGATHCTWCKGTNTGPFPAGDTCKGYYKCAQDNTLTSHCCPSGQSFDGSLCISESISTCQYTGKTSQIGFCERYYNCMGQQNVWKDCCYNSTSMDCLASQDCPAVCPDNGCDKEPIAGDECGFRTINVEQSELRCGPRTVFSISACGCVHGDITSCPAPVVATQDNKCTPRVNINWEDQQTSKWGFSSNRKYIGFPNQVNITNGRGEFNGKQNGLLHYTSAAPYLKEAYLFRASVKETSTSSSQEMVIFSNKPCSEELQSVLVTLTPSTRTVRFTIRTDEGVATSSLTYSSLGNNAWKEVSLRYDRVEEKMNAFVRLLDDDKNPIGDTQQDEQTLSGSIKTSSCPLKFAGEDTQNVDRSPFFFNGEMDDIKVYDCTSERTPTADSPSTQP